MACLKRQNSHRVLYKRRRHSRVLTVPYNFKRDILKLPKEICGEAGLRYFLDIDLSSRDFDDSEGNGALQCLQSLSNLIIKINIWKRHKPLIEVL